MKALLGTGVALVTPFTSDLKVDHDALARIVNYNIENGTNYLVISGTTGESVTITKQEKLEIVKTVSNTNKGRVPMVLGVGGNHTAAVIEEINTTDLSQFAAILSVSPYYSKPTQDGLYQHFKAVSEVSPVPIILYNVPGRTSKNMTPETILRLANDFDNVVAVKEAAGVMQQYLQLLKVKPKDFLVISGDDDLALSTTLAGGAGVISVIGQAFPTEFSEMIRLGREGQVQDAYKIHYKLMDVISNIFEENNPAGIKAVLQIKGFCNDVVRLPLVSATENSKSKIEASLVKL
ncbi:MAG: 4-hydroxy-tetrahydrodipicolinate synthase [Flavobacteriaceae bacterium]|nr:4-hydroxy-tetrahydrodipicolinate synthase [Flavobacteriaceae bacterium]